MSKNVIAVGSEAIRKAVEILGAVEIGKVTAIGLFPGSEWAADRMLLSVRDGSVEFVVGNTLYRQRGEDFQLAEFSDGAPVRGRAAWLQGLVSNEMPFCMGLAGELPRAWPATASVCAFLDRFSHFYRNHRTKLELARRQLGYVAEGLLALQHWPPLLGAVMNSMGEAAPGNFPKGLAASDLGVLLGRLLVDTKTGRTSLARVPDCVRAMHDSAVPEAADCLRTPHNRRMLQNLERYAESAAPLIHQLSKVL